MAINLSRSNMDNTLQEIFIQEAEDNLLILENGIISIEETPGDDEIINEVFRAIHSIKGGAGLAGFSGIKDFSHVVEDLFENIRSGVLSIEQDLISVILCAMDILKLMVSNIKGNRDSNDGVETEDTILRIKSYLGKTEAVSIDQAVSGIQVSKKNCFYINLSYIKSIFSSGTDPLMFISDLENAGEILYINTETDNLPDYTDFKPEDFYLEWKLFYETDKDKRDLIDIFCFVIDESDIKITNLNDILCDRKALSKYTINGKTFIDFKTESLVDPSTQAEDRRKNDRRGGDRRKNDRRCEDRVSDSYIRVHTEKLEKIFNSVSELLISQARLNMLTEKYEDSIPDSFGAVQDSLNNITKLIQEQVTSLRMMSLGSTFNRFKRVVRDIATDKGKKIKLLIEGQDTELDKNMIEKLNDPLKHIVRNCIDHGIETEEERQKAGKSVEGLLKMSAFLDSGKVVIEISDDGRGIDRGKLLKKAEEKGVIDSSTNLSDNEILSLIFHPGLSTAEQITDLSGRGVGMDVVKNCIHELHGNIDIISNKGSGTIFRLLLPLTLAILDGMLISVAKEKYIVPTLSILEIFKPESEDLKTVSGGKEVVFFRDSYIPLIRLYKIFDISNPIEEPVNGELIVINSGGIVVALLVDNVLEQYQVVLKSLQSNFKKVDNISSATILGDGEVALILDIQSIVNYA